MNEEQSRALEQVRDTYAVLHSFFDTTPNSPLPEPIRLATFRQLTDELMDAVSSAKLAGVPEHIIFESM